MKKQTWNLLARDYSRINDSRRVVVFPMIKELLRRFGCQRLLDYGGGDGYFARMCSELGLKSIVVFDPSSVMNELATQTNEGIESVTIVGSLKKIEESEYDTVTLNAVWMCLPTWDECIRVLNGIYSVLPHNGRLIASVTHPCFRDTVFSTYRTNFSRPDYFKNGSQFDVEISDGQNKIRLTDTHWNLSALSEQLRQAGFVISEIIELPEGDVSKVSPWLILICEKKM